MKKTYFYKSIVVFLVTAIFINFVFSQNTLFAENNDSSSTKTGLGDILEFSEISENKETSISPIDQHDDFLKNAELSYSKLMRKIANFYEDKKDDQKKLEETEKELYKNQLYSELQNFIEQEKYNSNLSNIDKDKKNKYLKRLEEQLGILSSEEKIKEFKKQKKEKKESKELKTPNNPGSFVFENKEIKIEKLKNFKILEQEENDKISYLQDRENQTANTQLSNGSREGSSRLSNTSRITSFFIPQANAQTQTDLPVLEDVTQDGLEIIINPEIEELAESLDRNPVNIINFVRNYVIYEPYYGAKKGALGCLHEKYCNDVDASSLTISLLRSAGIPARYKKSLALMPVEQLKSLLGVDETKTVYASLYWNKVPVFIEDGSNLGDDFQTADFSNETHLIVERVFVEIFYDYDERGGNIGNNLSFVDTTTTQEVQDILSSYNKKMWIPLDPIVKDYTHTQNEIVHNTANFDTESFWYGYLQYQGTLTPLEKYVDDLLTATGKDINDSLYQSIKEGIEEDYQILPPETPYQLGTGVGYLQENWSVFPDTRKHQTKISIIKEFDSSVILENTFNASKINNRELNLFFEGATQTDKDIIESYGGIHETPAELVSIVPYFETGFSRYETSNTISIGDSLILRFEYVLDNQVLHTDEKFSVAGNHEGIYIIFSRVEENSLLEDDTDSNLNSKILLEGNSEFARQYLKRLQDKGDFLEKTLDLEYNFQFTRAVVTQNRILNEVGGVPTTFDFKGLSMDAVTYVTDYSNRGNFEMHRKDFHLLWGLQASYDEAQIFTDIAGLDGISTVKGLQHAYANPLDYTVHIIDSSNESVIDTLALSDNTKANMHTAVQAGDTVITPDKFVSDDNWYGLFYIALKDDGTGQYAIGEQVGQNGGWTTVYLNWTVYNGGQYLSYIPINPSPDDQQFCVQEQIYGSVKCTATKAEHDATEASNPGYQDDYGCLCLRETETFGTVDHSYVVTTDAAKFYSDGLYNYWKRASEVKSILESDKNNDNLENLSNIRLNGTFKFNVIAGTYSQYGLYDELVGTEPITAYYQPSDNNDRGYGRMVYDDMLDKLMETHYEAGSVNNGCEYGEDYCGKKNWVLHKLGYPTGNRGNATESFAGTTGWYQDFVGGQMYKEKFYVPYYSPIGGGVTLVYKTYYVLGKIEEYYNRPDYCRIVNNGDPICGSGGIFGFAKSDPILKDDDVTISQEFEEAVIEYNKNTDFLEVVNLTEEGRRLGNKEFARKILIGKDLNFNGTDGVMGGEITDVEAFAIIADYIAKRTKNNDDFMKDLTIILTGFEKIGSLNYWLTKGINKLPLINIKSKFVIEGFSDTGFKFIYNDSHYCADEHGNNGDCLSNQLYHAMGGFNGSYFWGYNPVTWADLIHEGGIPSSLGIDGSSQEDRNLTIRMARLGTLILGMDKNEVSSWILNNLAVASNIGSFDENGKYIPNSSYDYLRKSQSEIKRLGEYKRKFRQFEYEENCESIVFTGLLTCDIQKYWNYIKDMDVDQCNNGKEIYYQDYEFFYWYGLKQYNVRTIWNKYEEKMIFLNEQKSQEYRDINNICSDLSILTEYFGISLGT